jgi:arylsulfatase
LTKDWTQYDNVAEQYPQKLKELENLFWVEARKHQVLLLDATVAGGIVTPRLNLAAGRMQFTWSGEIAGTPNGDAPFILDSRYNFQDRSRDSEWRR